MENGARTHHARTYDDCMQHTLRGPQKPACMCCECLWGHCGASGRGCAYLRAEQQRTPMHVQRWSQVVVTDDGPPRPTPTYQTSNPSTHPPTKSMSDTHLSHRLHSTLTQILPTIINRSTYDDLESHTKKHSHLHQNTLSTHTPCHNCRHGSSRTWLLKDSQQNFQR